MGSCIAKEASYLFRDEVNGLKVTCLILPMIPSSLRGKSWYDQLNGSFLWTMALVVVEALRTMHRNLGKGGLMKKIGASFF